jgi:hypothetical protein
MAMIRNDEGFRILPSLLETKKNKRKDRVSKVSQKFLYELRLSEE